MEGRPPYIRAFETLQLVSAFIGLIHGFAIGQLFVPIFGTIITITLTLLISRGQKNWARWVLAGIWALGLALVVLGFFLGVTQEALSTTYPVLTVLVWVMQLVAVALLFTPQSARWLRSDQSKALHRVFE